MFHTKKMDIKIISKDNKEAGTKSLPVQFSEEYRPNLIKRAVHSLQSAARQAYGAHPRAGMRHSSDLSKRRRKYRGCYGFGISRVNRKIHSRRGTRFFWVGASSPQTRGGRRSHPPKAEKQWGKKINKKENRKAIRSAIAATVDKDLVSSRGHKIPSAYPFIISSDLESLSKTSDIKKTLLGFGFEDEIERSAQKKVRAGRGKSRARRYQKKKGILVVVSGDCALSKAARNIAGLEVVPASSLNCNVLAPGAQAGRVTLWTESAIDKLTSEKLYL